MPFRQSSELLWYKMQLTVSSLLGVLFFANHQVLSYFPTENPPFFSLEHSLMGRDCQCPISSKHERENGENKVLFLSYSRMFHALPFSATQKFNSNFFYFLI